ncbi:MAG: hypothetical protein PVF74_14950, partial [Anaerolineales bacterium]
MDFPLYIPLIFVLAGLLIALVYGVPFINRRLRVKQVSWLLSLFPLAAFISLMQALSAMQDGSAISWQFNWLPASGIQGSLYYDNLSAVFALLVTGIGTLVLIYSG